MFTFKAQIIVKYRNFFNSCKKKLLKTDHSAFFSKQNRIDY
jgi:hypothetical protein